MSAQQQRLHNNNKMLLEKSSQKEVFCSILHSGFQAQLRLQTPLVPGSVEEKHPAYQKLSFQFK